MCSVITILGNFALDALKSGGGEMQKYTPVWLTSRCFVLQAKIGEDYWIILVKLLLFAANCILGHELPKVGLV